MHLWPANRDPLLCFLFFWRSHSSKEKHLLYVVYQSKHQAHLSFTFYKLRLGPVNFITELVIKVQGSQSARQWGTSHKLLGHLRQDELPTEPPHHPTSRWDASCSCVDRHLEKLCHSTCRKQWGHHPRGWNDDLKGRTWYFLKAVCILFVDLLILP